MLFDVHSLFSLFATAMFLSYKTLNVEVEGSTLFSSLSCNEGDVLHSYNYKREEYFFCAQIEVQFLKGLESATITFTVSVFIFAILTILLLKFSGGRKPLKIYHCFVIYRLYSTDPNSTNNETKEGEQVNIITIPKGILDADTFYALAAICDAIATSMLTPWYCFKKKKNEDKDYNVSLESRTLIPSVHLKLKALIKRIFGEVCFDPPLELHICALKLNKILK